MKLPYSFKLDEKLLSDLQTEAPQANRSFNNYVENLLLTHPARGGFKAKKPSTERKSKR
jgi:hypothetical protein